MASAESGARGSQGGGTQSLRRALRLVLHVARADGDGMRLTDLVGRSGLERSTAHRMLTCLVEEGLLQRGDDRRYRLGRQTFELGLAAERLFDEHIRARPVLSRLATALGETVFLSVRNTAETVCLERVNGKDGGAGLRTDVGTRRPMGIGAGGMALLAAMRPAEAEAMVRSNDRAYRSFGRNTPLLLRRRLEVAQRDGFALAESYFSSGILGIGVVVPPTPSAPPLAISVVGRASRLTQARREAVAAQLRAAAEDVARCIGRAARVSEHAKARLATGR